MRVGSRPQIDAQAAAVGGRVLALDLLKECVRVGTTIVVVQIPGSHDQASLSRLTKKWASSLGLGPARVFPFRGIHAHARDVDNSAASERHKDVRARREVRSIPH